MCFVDNLFPCSGHHLEATCFFPHPFFCSVSHRKALIVQICNELGAGGLRRIWEAPNSYTPLSTNRCTAVNDLARTYMDINTKAALKPPEGGSVVKYRTYMVFAKAVIANRCASVCPMYRQSCCTVSVLWSSMQYGSGSNSNSFTSISCPFRSPQRGQGSHTFF